MPRVLITGGTGFVGARLVERLSVEGFDIVCLVRSLDAAQRILSHKNVQLVQIDFKQRHALAKALQDAKADYVYHLAGSVYESSKTHLFEVNANGTENIYAALKGLKVKAFIYLSSLAAVGPVSNNSLITENTTARPLSFYGKSKLEAEKRIQRLWPEVCVPIYIVRPPLIYGSGMSLNSRLAFLIRRLSDRTFKLIGNGENYVSFCDVETVTGFFVHLLRVEVCGCEVYHVADQMSMTMKEMAAFTAKIIHAPFTESCLPVGLAKAIACALDFFGKIFSFEHAMTSERVCEVAGNWKLDLTKAMQTGFITKEDCRMKFERAILDLQQKIIAGK